MAANIYQQLQKQIFGMQSIDGSVNTSGSSATVTTNDLELPNVARIKPMRVLSVGMCRTGDVAIGEALKILGFTPFGMAEGTKDPAYIFPRWEAAQRAKYYGDGRRWKRPEFDRMLSQYDATLAVPACMLAEDLVEAYPEAKVILMERDTAGWVNSMARSCELLTWGCWDFVKRWDTSFAGPLIAMIQTQMGAFCNQEFTMASAGRRFEEHNALVRRIVPPERLLVFQNEMEWEPLCKFLDVPVPDRAYPYNSDDTDDERIRLFQKAFWWIGMARSVGKMGLTLALPVVLGWAVYRREFVVDMTKQMLERLHLRLV